MEGRAAPDLPRGDKGLLTPVCADERVSCESLLLLCLLPLRLFPATSAVQTMLLLRLQNILIACDSEYSCRLSSQPAFIKVASRGCRNKARDSAELFFEGAYGLWRRVDKEREAKKGGPLRAARASNGIDSLKGRQSSVVSLERGRLMPA